MNTLTNAYKTRFSSGIIATILLISAFMFLTPVVLPAHATTAQFKASLSYPYARAGGYTATRDIEITNPSGNPAITEIDVNVPVKAAQTIATDGAIFVDGFINTGTPAVAGSGPWTAVYAGATSGVTILPQGAAGHIDITFTSEAAESTSGVVDGYALTVQVTYSTGATQTLVLTLYEGAAGTVTATLNTAASVTAGTSSSFTAALDVADRGVPLIFSSTPSISTLVSDGFSASFTPSSGVSSSSGTLSTSFLATEATTYKVSADAGTMYGTDGGGNLGVVLSGTLTMTPAAPTQVSVSTVYDVGGVTPTYISSPLATTLTIGLADRYGNLVPAVTGVATITAIAGTLNHKHLGFTAGGTNTTITYAPISTATGTPLLKYGTFDLITVSLVVSGGAPPGTYTGSSKQLTIGYISTTDVATLTPTVNIYTVSTGSANPAAGTKVGLSLTLSNIQQNVPVNFTLTSTSLTVPYTGTFSNGLSWIVAYTNVNGVAAANFTADKIVPDAATAQAIVSEPTTSVPRTTVASISTAAITTGPSTASSLKVITCLDSLCVTPISYTTPSSKLYIDVLLQDAYGNSVKSPFTFALQVSLSASAGGLSSTTVYITTGSFDTIGSGYVVQYSAPTTLGTVTLAAGTTQPGFTGISKVLTVVSPDPRVFLTSGLTVNSTTSAIAGYAMPSLAASPTTFVTTFTYSLNGAASVTVPITATNSSSAAFFSFIAPLLNGANTVVISATDSTGYVGTITETITVSVTPAVTLSNSIVIKGSPIKTTIGAYTGISANYTNDWTTSQHAIVFAVWKNSASQTVAVTTSGLTLAVGATGTAFAPLLAPLPSGTYTVNVFVVTTANTPVSATSTITVTV